ncbi:MAG: ATP-binding protein [Polyangiaceae bacterium]|nr:ATP-binding protein [Polyangiaceae bacterium]NUQ79329.1 ATP-binding protein [Polyangiaceae bacterium]
MSSIYNQLIAILTRYMSGVNAHGILGNAVRQALLNPDQLHPRDIEILIPRLDRGIRLFVEVARQKQLWTEIEALSGRRETPSHTVSIRSEQDISQARVLAKAMCENARAKSFVTQKVATVVSELARNIVSYTQGGSIELVMAEGSQARILVRATDTGPGIPNIDEVLSGRYRSATGLGKGLVGVKRLADRFNIRTSKNGTQIEAEVHL